MQVSERLTSAFLPRQNEWFPLVSPYKNGLPQEWGTLQHRGAPLVFWAASQALWALFPYGTSWFSIRSPGAIRSREGILTKASSKGDLPVANPGRIKPGECSISEGFFIGNTHSIHWLLIRCLGYLNSEQVSSAVTRDVRAPIQSRLATGATAVTVCA